MSWRDSSLSSWKTDTTCFLAVKEGGTGGSWRGRQRTDHVGSCKPRKEFWYLSQKTLKDFKQENETSVYTIQDHSHCYTETGKEWVKKRWRNPEQLPFPGLICVLVSLRVEDVNTLKTCWCKNESLFTWSQLYLQSSQYSLSKFQCFFPKSFPSE